MKRTYFFISMFLLVANLFLSNGFAQDYVHYATLADHTHSVLSIAFSPDGSTLASGSFKEVILWDVVTGHRKSTLTHTSWARSVLFSPDGETLASGSDDGIIRVWEVPTGIQKVYTLPSYSSGSTVNSVVFSPDGETLASGSVDGIRMWDIGTGSLKSIFGHTDADNSITSVSFSSDGQTLASGDSDGNVCLWEIATGSLKNTLTGHAGPIESVCFSPGGRILASGSWDGNVCLWEIATGSLKNTFSGNTGWVYSVSFSPDGETLASGGWSKIHLWDVGKGHLKTSVTWTVGYIESVCFSPDGRMLAGGSDDGIRIWQLSSPRPLLTHSPTLPKPADQVYNSAIRSVMWIVNPGISEGSGVLFDKKFKLAVTNAHVTGIKNTVDVYFPAPDENGELIKDRNFYLTSRGVLKRLGYYTKGHVVAKNEETDLAIIKLEGLPKTAREIDWNFTTPTTNTGDLVYILGNPGGQELWRWTLGEFLNDPGDFLYLQSDVFGGNSGGPVLNKQGLLIGIVARSDRHMNALAIPVRDINELLSESGLEHSHSGR